MCKSILPPLVFLLLAVFPRICFGAACIDGKDYFPSKVSPSYSKNWQISYHNSYKLLTVFSSSQYQYALKACDDAPVPSDAVVLSVPIDSVASTETTFVGYVSVINQANSLSAVMNTSFLCDPALRVRADDGLIATLCLLSGGYCTYTVNSAVLNEKQVDVVLTDSYTASSISEGAANGEHSSVPIVIQETTESHPLGRAEWLKAVAALYNLEATANSEFDGIARRYADANRAAMSASGRPSVMVNSPANYTAFESHSWDATDLTWYAAGPQSYIVRLIKDAGATYAFEAAFAGMNTTGLASFPFSTSTLATYATAADVWINTDFYPALESATVAQVAQRDGAAYSAYKSVQCSAVVPRDGLTNSYGFVAFFESGVVQPDVVLWELVRIFHPNWATLPFTYYFPLRPSTKPSDVSCYADTSAPSSGDSGLSGGEIAGIVIGCAAAVALIIGGAMFFVGYRRGYAAIPSGPAPRTSLDVMA
mmetsp:Transcript_6074/g.10481  ORF Transcript_6074/g.10481 Transcript_6074/m.10481 type:complete len:480 (-) Transcript_6074:397-1836(-)